MCRCSRQHGACVDFNYHNTFDNNENKHYDNDYDTDDNYDGYNNSTTAAYDTIDHHNDDYECCSPSAESESCYYAFSVGSF